MSCASAWAPASGRSSCPRLAEGAVYKFEIIGGDGKLLPLKSDPYGFAAELGRRPPRVVARADSFTWSDGGLSWPGARREGCPPGADVDL